jgi:regulator of sigma E protease
MTFLTSALAFIVAIAILVAIHEYGHFWVARKMGVKVLRYSIGFGKPLWKWQSAKDETEYVVAAIPLGGYVKMLDEREGEVRPEERALAFNTQPVGKRFAIVAAGPLFNFAFAIVAYALMYFVGVSGLKPVIGEVHPDSIAAEAGLNPGDEIQSINGKLVPSWEIAVLTLIDQALEEGTLEVRTTSSGGEFSTHHLDLSDTRKLLGGGETDLLKVVGLQPWRPQLDPILGQIEAGGAAARAGLQSGDRLLSVAGEEIKTWAEWVTYIREHPAQTLSLEVERNGQTLQVQLLTASVEESGVLIGRIGAGPKVDRALFDHMRVEVRYGPVEAFVQGMRQTWDMSALLVRVLWKMVTLEASLKNISGPLSIAEFAGVSAKVGFSAFLGFLALISVSLGVMNLLPVPVLDGGHLLFYLIEWIKGSPVSEATEAIGQRVGFALLGALMFLAFYNDITRLLS